MRLSKLLSPSGRGPKYYGLRALAINPSMLIQKTMKLTFTPLNPEHFEAMASWFAPPHTDSYIGGFYGQPKQWYKLVEGDQNRFGWLVLEGDEPVGLFDLDIHDEEGHIAYAVAPAARGRGVGKAVIGQALHLPEVRGCGCLRAGVEPDNASSLKCLEANGFVEDYLDEEEGIQYLTLRLPPPKPEPKNL